MPTLSVDLQEGFDNDLVIVQIDGREEYRNDNVTTKRLLGYADTFSVSRPAGRLAIHIAIPLKNLDQSADIDLLIDKHFAVSIVDNKIEHRISDRPFGYM